LTTWGEVWDPAFVSEWRGWIDQSPDAHVFFEPSLVRAWYETYRELRGIEPRFLVAREGSERIVFSPLVFDRRGWKDGWLRVIQPAGHNEFDYHDPICSGPCTKEMSSSFWIALKHELDNGSIDFDLLCLPRIRESCAGRLQGFQETGKSPFLDLSISESFEDVLSSLSGNMRQGIRRKQRRLEKLGETKLRVFDKGEVGPATGMLTGFLRTHKARWPQAYRAEGFFERLIVNVLPQGLLHLSTLECDGRPISWHIGFVHKLRFYWYVPSYDSEMSRYSPGQIHLAKLINEALSQGVEAFDFLRGEERYKLEWTAESVGLYECRLLMPGVRPRLRSGFRALLRGGAGLLGR